MEIDLDDDFDFGFSSVPTDSVVTVEEIKANEAVILNKAEKMYKNILPLLNNLAKDSEKNEYIKWPNRAAKIEEFKKRLEAILNS